MADSMDEHEYGGYLPWDQHQARQARIRIRIARQAEGHQALATVKADVWGEPELWRDSFFAAKFLDRNVVRPGWNTADWTAGQAKMFEAAYGKPSTDFRRSGS